MVMSKALLLMLVSVSLCGGMQFTRPAALRAGGVQFARPAALRVAGGLQALAKKKGGGKKKGKQPKTSGMDWASNFELKPTESAALRELVEMAASTYKTRTGKSLDKSLDRGTSDVPKALWVAPVCLMVVREAEAGTLITYANVAAAEAHGLTASDGYKQLLEAATTLPAALADGKYESGYGKKLPMAAGAAGGDAFTLRGAERWALEKMAVVDGKLASERIGLAYAWRAWELADGTECAPGGVRTAPQMDPAEVQAAVDAQGALVRKLKDEDGLTNGDAEVKAAVAELLRLKALLPPPE